MDRSKGLSRFLTVAGVALLALGIAACWGEHPEHPAEEGQSPSIEAVAAFLEDHVAQQGGSFTVHDDKAHTDLSMTLDRVHRERLSKTGEGTYFVCADFLTPDGKRYDLDFWVRGKEGEFSVTEVMIHKEEGAARYTWVEEGGIWKKSPV